MNEQTYKWIQENFDSIRFVILNHKDHAITQDKIITNLRKNIKYQKKFNRSVIFYAFMAGMCYTHVRTLIREQTNTIKRLSEEIEGLKETKGE